ncbi:unnamed protein product [Blepharisma stoltei]|uniref:Phosphatidic acid phosphatase type 2/haloperoxidase domain-containing protein n=1 Tax=Blepharisma stoltei TaxID=1481888 RepID=A0AAU9IXU0_9CILI|nr:unnamed protein product [Blepharisma stoltei]
MKTILFFALLAFVLTIIAILKEDELEDSSASLTRWLQKRDNETIEYIFSHVGKVTGVGFLLMSGTLFLIGKRDIGLVGLICGLLGVCISGALKMEFAHPRPFWKYSNLEGEECPKDFGTPSGHAMSAGGGLFILGYIWIKTADSKLWRTIIVIFISLITAIDRVYIGVHFHFQVILGYSYAALVVAILLHPNTLEYIKSFRNNTNSVLQTHVVLVAGLIVGAFIYDYRNPLWNPSWSEKYRERCHTGLSVYSPMIKSFGETNIVMFIAGMIIGVYFLKNKAYPKFSIILLIVSIVLHHFLMASLKYIDAMILENLNGLVLIFVLSIHRYTFGFAHTFLLPQLLSIIFGEEKHHDSDDSFHWIKLKSN